MCAGMRVCVCVHAFGGLTPGGWAGIGCCSGESYVRGGRDSVYVVELTEHGGAPSHRSLKRTASLERAHYLHLQDRHKTAALSEDRKVRSECVCVCICFLQEVSDVRYVSIEFVLYHCLGAQKCAHSHCFFYY